MPKSFEDSGAFGAGGSNTGYNAAAPTPAAQTSPVREGTGFSYNPSGGDSRASSGPASFAGGGGDAPSWKPDRFDPTKGLAEMGPVNRFDPTARRPLFEAGWNQSPVNNQPLFEAGWNQSPVNNQPRWQAGFDQAGGMFAAGGQVGVDEELGFDPMAGMRSDLMDRLAAARQAVRGALDFGRKQNGLEGLSFADEADQQTAAASDPPIAGGVPFGPKPFGQRRVPPPRTSMLEGGDDGAGEELGFNPSQSETGLPRPMPGPGTLPAPSNPFGRRPIPPVRTSEADEPEGDQQQELAGAIPETDEEDQEYA